MHVAVSTKEIETFFEEKKIHVNRDCCLPQNTCYRLTLNFSAKKADCVCKFSKKNHFNCIKLKIKRLDGKHCRSR